MGKNLFGKLNRKALNLILGGILFVVLSAGYDVFVGDRTIFRWVILSIGIVIVLLAVFLRIINSKKVKRTLERQMGG